MDHGCPIFNRNPSRAQVFLSEQRAEAVQQMLRPHRLITRTLTFTRPPAEPLAWRLADDQIQGLHSPTSDQVGSRRQTHLERQRRTA